MKDVVAAIAADAPADSMTAEPRRVLELYGLRKSFDAVEILKGVDLVVREGEMVFIIGSSGSGKSTLLRCCNRLEEPSDGAVIVEGVNILRHGVDLNQIRRRIGMVFQSFNLYPHMTARQNVTLALRKVAGKSRTEADAIAERMLTHVGLGDRIDFYPSALSGGQQQRVAIARTLALEPRIVLFDEPTSALDPELVNGVLSVMRMLRDEGMTMVVVSHEMRFARDAADRILFMADGLILEQGSPREIFGAPKHPRLREFLSSLSGV
jgi:polar amino acid transport system ATP-binding protein